MQDLRSRTIKRSRPQASRMTVDVIELNMEVIEKLGWGLKESGVAFTKN